MEQQANTGSPPALAPACAALTRPQRHDHAASTPLPVRDNQAAKACGVSHPFVGQVRRSLRKNEVTNEDQGPRTYTTKHGTTAVVDTTTSAGRKRKRSLVPCLSRGRPLPSPKGGFYAPFGVLLWGVFSVPASAFPQWLPVWLPLKRQDYGKAIILCRFTQ